MYTAQEVDAWIAQMKAEGASKAKIIDTASDMCIGWPYVFGAAGIIKQKFDHRDA